MKTSVYSLGVLVLALAFSSLFTSCTDDWTEEQYEQLIGFRAPISSSTGVTAVYVPYSRKDTLGNFKYGSGQSSYELPVVVSGTLNNKRNIVVNVAHDPDTLDILNQARFQRRTDYYYTDMSQFATVPATCEIESGKDVGLLDIKFNFKGIDLSNKYVLPLRIAEGSGYKVNGRKNYHCALLRIYPFNDYSGNYSGSMLSTYLDGDTGNGSIVKNTVTGYVVDDNTIFFYTGNFDEDRTDRANYKVFATFHGKDNGTVDFYVTNDSLNFKCNKQASFRIFEQQDAKQPYLMHRYLVINNIDYNWTDYTSLPGFKTNYLTRGSLTLERKINTQIPDEDQAVEW